MLERMLHQKSILKRFVLFCFAAFSLVVFLVLLSLVVLLLIRIFLPWMKLWHVLIFNSVFSLYCVWYSLAKKLREKSIIIKITEQIVLGLWLITCIAYVLSKILQ